MSLLPNDTFYGPGLPIWLKNPISSIIVSSGSIQNLTVNNIQFPYQLLSSISSALLLNGVAIATVDNISSLSEWSYDPAISTVRINNNNITGISTFFAETGFISSLNTTNLLATNIITSNLAAYNIVNFYSTSIETFTSTIISEIDLARISSAQIGVEFVSSASISSLSVIAGNANSLSVSSLNVSSGNVILSNATIADLSVTNSASFAGSRPNFTTGINTSGANNFNNTTLDNVGRITANTVFIGSPNYINTQTSSFTAILNNRGADVGGNSVIDIKSQFGAATRVNITADASSALAPTPTQLVTITANGATSLTQNAVGGRVSIVANAGSGSGCNILGFGEIDMTAYSSLPFAGVIKESAGSILAYSGLTVPTVGVFGSGFYSALNCLSLTAGATPATTSFPGVVFLRGDNGTKVLNGFFVDTINNTVLYDLDISSKTAGDISNRNLNINSACNLVLNSSNGGQVIINGAAYPPSPGAGVWASTATTALNMAGFGIINLVTLTALSGYDLSITATARTINLTGNFINLVGGSGIILNGNITGSALLTMNSAGVINLSGGNLSNAGNIFGSNLSITTGGNLTLGSSTGGSVNINSRTNISSINVSSINGASYPPTSGSGVWASTATTALNMANFNINNIFQLNFSNSANIDGTYPNQLNFNASNSYFLGNLRLFGSGRTLDIADNIIQNVTTIYGSSGGFLTLNAVYGMVIENNQGARIALNTNADLELRTLSTAQISINQTAGSDFTLFNNGDTRMNAVRDAYVQGNRDTYLLANQNMNIRAPNTQYITIQQSGLANDSFIQFQPSGVIDQFSRLNMSIRTLSTNSITIEQQGAAYNSFLQFEASGTSVLQSRSNLNIRTLSTNQLTIYQESGSDFILFNNGDTRQNAVRDAYVGGNRNVLITALQDSYLRAQSNVILETTTGYINLVAQGGSNGIYCTGAFTELRGYLTFNAVNNYINNLEHIYGDASAPGGGLAIDGMYGLFFNSSGKNANLYIDSGNLNMINYNSGINIANYNGFGTGNLSLFSQNNDIYITSGAGRDINLNGGRYVSINAAQPGGSFGIYASTMNAGTLVDMNFNCGGNYSLTGGGSSQYVTFQNAGTSIQFAGPNLYVGTTTGGLSLNLPVSIGSAYSLDMQQAPITNVSSINATSNLHITATSTIITGDVQRFLISSNIPQPIIQMGQVSSSGSSGSITVTIPQRYTSVSSYLPFACMADAPAAELYVSTLTRATFEIGWQNGGGGNQLFNWNTMGF